LLKDRSFAMKMAMRCRRGIGSIGAAGMSYLWLSSCYQTLMIVEVF
jgi:hypothetical protein